MDRPSTRKKAAANQVLPDSEADEVVHVVLVVPVARAGQAALAAVAAVAVAVVAAAAAIVADAHTDNSYRRHISPTLMHIH